MEIRMDNKNILNNDPSVTAWGWSITDWKENILDAGCIKTKSEHKKRRIRKGDDTVRRISIINKKLKEIVDEYNVGFMTSELPHGSQSASAATMIGIVTGIIQTWSDALNIGIEWYSQGDVKKCLFGRQSVTKAEMIDKIDSIYSVPWTDIKYRDEAIADSLGVYRTFTQKSSMFKLMRN